MEEFIDENIIDPDLWKKKTPSDQTAKNSTFFSFMRRNQHGETSLPSRIMFNYLMQSQAAKQSSFPDAVDLNELTDYFEKKFKVD